MRVSDVLAHIRARLRDDNAEFTRTGDSFIINQIRYWQNQLLSEFNQNIAEFKAALKEKSEFELDFEPLKIVAAFLNGEALRLVSYESAIKSRGELENILFQKRGQLFGFENKKTGELEIYAVKKAFVKEADDELVLDDGFENLLVFSVYLDILKTSTTPDNSQRLNFMLGLLEQENLRMRAAQNALNSPASFKTKCVRV